MTNSSMASSSVVSVMNVLKVMYLAAVPTLRSRHSRYCRVSSDGTSTLKKRRSGSVNHDLKSEGTQLNSSVCTLWDYGDGYEDCSNLQFASESSAFVKDVQITPYITSSVVNFNITFKNIKWQFLQYRIQVGGDNNMCHRLQFNSLLHDPLPLQVSFACNAFGSFAHGEEAIVSMEIGSSSSNIIGFSNFIMKVPVDKRHVDSSDSNITINDWIILVVVDISHSPNLIIYWPAVPRRFGVSQYNIFITGDTPKINVSSCYNDYCLYEYFAGYTSRNISISVQPVHDDCHKSCISSSPIINLKLSLPAIFVSLIVLIPILIVLLIICAVYYFCCSFPAESLEVLLLFDATEKQHCRVVRILAEYLMQHARVHCLLADENIPRSSSQNPTKWLDKSLDEVDAILVVASPSSIHPIRFSEYPHILNEALPMIEKRRKCPAHNRPGRFLVVVPPYCSSDDIPENLQDLPRFAVPEELRWLLWTIYNQHCWIAPFRWMAKLYLRCCCCPGPMSSYRQYGQRLDDALKDAVAAQRLVEQAPLTPISSRRTGWTGCNPQDDDNMSMPYGNYPGNINKLPLLGGSLASEDSIAPKTAIDLNTLPL